MRVTLDSVASGSDLRANELEREIPELAKVHAATLVDVPECAALTAAKIVAETAQISPFDRTHFPLGRNGCEPGIFGRGTATGSTAAGTANSMRPRTGSP